MPSNNRPDEPDSPHQHPLDQPVPAALTGRTPDDLPIDSDVDSFEPPAAAADRLPSGQKPRDERAAHHQFRLIGLVFIGGAFGALSRSSLTHLVGSPDGFPVSTLVENVVGAFLLGVLLEALSRRGPDHGRRRRLRLLLGTGYLGGFTTYSSFAVDAVHLLGAGETFQAILYLALTILVGAAASFTGIWCASVHYQHRHPPAQEPDDDAALAPDQPAAPGADATSSEHTDPRAPGHRPDTTGRRTP